MGAFYSCEPYHQRPPVGEFFREDAILRAAIPIPFLCPLDKIGIATRRSLPEVVEEAITQYCLARGVDPNRFRAG